MAEIAAIVLAAGRATRFGAGAGTKVTAAFDGQAMVARVVETALAAGARPIVVVTGHAAEATRQVLVGLAVEMVHNAAYRDGLAGSLQAGLAAVPDQVDGVLVLLADMPMVRARTLERLIAAFARERPDAVVPTFEGREGNPVLLGRALFPALAGLEGDAGARRLLAETHRRVSTCAVDDPGIEIDIDTPAVLAALAGRERQ